MASIHILVMDSLEDTQRIPAQKFTNFSPKETLEQGFQNLRETRLD
jgi:hypothetical protein